MTETKVRFDLRGLIREICVSSPSNNYGMLAKEVSARVDDEDLRDALEQVLPSLIQDEVHRHRRETSHVPSAQSNLVPEQRAPGHSWKVSGIRRHAEELRKRYATGFGPNSVKTLGDFTIEDCRSAFAMHTKLAKGNALSAERYAAYVDVLEQHRCATISALPNDVLDLLFGGVK
ncbi:MAG: hypothetical protein ACRDRY_21230 [Pseudonocardiaceae bacterium]